MEFHMHKYHKELLLKDGIKLFICNLCDKQCYSKSYLKKHKDNHVVKELKQVEKEK